MTRSSVKWYGNQLLAQIEAATPEAAMEAGEMLIKAAAGRVRDRSGVLSKSGYVASEKRGTYRRHKLHNKQAQVPKGGVVAGFAAFYSRFVEFGTKRASAKPFLRPAFDELKGRIGMTIVKNVGKKLK